MSWHHKIGLGGFTVLATADQPSDRPGSEGLGQLYSTSITSLSPSLYFSSADMQDVCLDWTGAYQDSAPVLESYAGSGKTCSEPDQRCCCLLLCRLPFLPIASMPNVHIAAKTAEASTIVTIAPMNPAATGDTDVPLCSSSIVVVLSRLMVAQPRV